MARMTYGLMVAGMRPSLTSLRQKPAVSTLTATSHAATRPVPPAYTSPWMRATVGLGHSYRVRSMSASLPASATFSSRL